MTIPVKLNNPKNEAIAKVIFSLRHALDDFCEDSCGLTLDEEPVWDRPEMDKLNKALVELNAALSEVEMRV